MSNAQPTMSNIMFRFMTLTFRLLDALLPYVEKRARRFSIRSGMTVVDYGCGPGRYTERFADLVGYTGMVYAVDIHPLAIAAIHRIMERKHVHHIHPLMAASLPSDVPDGIADIVCAIDMFFVVRDKHAFLGELRRIIKADGMLIIDGGHQSMARTREQIQDSGFW